MNAGRYIYAASSNSETIYAFTKIAGSDDNDDFETEVDGFNIIFRVNTYMDAIILTS